MPAPAFDPSQPFSPLPATGGGTTEAPAFDPSQPYSEAPGDPLAQRTQKYQKEQDQGALPYVGDYLTGLVNNLPAAASGLWETAKAAGSTVADLATGSEKAGQDLFASARAQLPAAQERYLSNPARFFTSHLYPGGNSPAELSAYAKQDLASEEAVRRELNTGANPERAGNLMAVTDPLNLAFMALPAVGALGRAGMVGADAARAGATAAELATPKVSFLRRAAASALLDPLAGAAEKVGGVTKTVSEAPKNLVKSVGESYGVPQTFQAAAGKTVTLGAIGGYLGGPGGAVLGAGIANAPEIAANIASFSRAAARALRAGEGSVPFFEAIAKDPTVTAWAANLAAVIDRTGLGGVIEGAARTVTGAGKVAALFAPFDVVTTGGDPNAASAQTISNFAFAALGHVAGEPFRADSREVIALKQANDIAAFMKSRTPADVEGIMDRLKTSQDPRELVALAQYARANPNVRWSFVHGGAEGVEGAFTTQPEGTISVNLDAPNWIPQIVAHEMLHENAAAGLRPDILKSLLGNPETRSDGYLVRYGADGAPQYTPEFSAFRDSYLTKLRSSLLAQGLPETEVANRLAEYDKNPGSLAEEWAVTSMGAWLSSFTNKGELVYTRIRRNKFTDYLMSRFVREDPVGLPTRLARLFNVTDLKKPKFGVGGIPNELRRLFTDYIRKDKSMNPRGENFEYDTGFNTGSFSDKDISQNPQTAHRMFGNSNEIKFSTDEHGNVNGIDGFRSKREAEKLSQAQAAAIVSALKERAPENEDVLQRREREDVRGIKTVEYSGKYLPDDVIATLEKSNLFSPTQLDSIRRQNATMATGQPTRIFYQQATHRGKAGAYVGKYEDIIPFGWLLSEPEGKTKGVNLLIRGLDLGQVSENYDAAVRRFKKGGPEVAIPTKEEAMGQLKTYLKNQSLGYGGAGDVREGTPVPQQPPAGTLTPGQRDFINELLGVDLPYNAGRNKYRLKVQETEGAPSRSAIKSFRMDRTATLETMASEGATPVDYRAIKFNFSPAEGKSQTDTPEFKKWFGESKVVDEGGKPLVVYHGTDEKFTVFDKTKARSEKAFKGFFFTTNRDAAADYGDHQLESMLSIKKPFEFTADKWKKGARPPPVEELKRKGYDGIVLRDHNLHGDEIYSDRGDTWIAFEPTQIKSAIGNRGTFDAGNPDIRYSPAAEAAGTEGEKTEKYGIEEAAPGRWSLFQNQDGKKVHISSFRSKFEAERSQKQLESWGGGGLRFSPAEKEEQDRALAYKPEVTSTGKLKGASEAMPTMRRYNKVLENVRGLIDEGVNGRHWYEDSAQQVLKMTNGDLPMAEKFVQLLAIYSPNAAVPSNTVAATKVFNQWRAGVPREQIHGGLGALDEKARALLFDNQSWEGRKTNSFYLNLMHDLVADATPEELSALHLPEDLKEKLNKAVTVDTWMLRAFGYLRSSATDDKGTGRYSLVENSIQKLTAELNQKLKPGEEPWLPHQVQAAIWTAVKSRYELEGVKEATKKESVRKGFSQYEDGIWTMPATTEARESHNLVWNKHAMAADPADVKSHIEKTAASFADVLGKMTQNVTWEAVPFGGDLVDQGSPAAKAAYTEAARKLIFDEHGNDLLAQKLGISLLTTDMGSGSFEGNTTPNTITGIITTKVFDVADKDGKVLGSYPEKVRAEEQRKALGENAHRVVTHFDTKKVEAYARAIQYIYQQKAVPYFRADPGLLGKKGKAAGVRIEFSQDLTPEVERAFYEALQKDLSKDHNYTRLNDRNIAVVNYTAMPDEEFFEKLDGIANDHAQKLNLEHSVRFGAEGDYGPEHDWRNDPSGEALRVAASAGGRPDLSSWLYSRHLAAAELLKQWSGPELQKREAELAQSPQQSRGDGSLTPRQERDARRRARIATAAAAVPPQEKTP